MPDPVNEMTAPRFSICIPNFNYGRYLNDTISGVLAQNIDNIEIHVVDNASTDDSVAVVQAFDEPRIHLRVNETNVGLGPNLDRAAGQAKGDIMILLSSDDLMRPGALEIYDRIFGSDPSSTMFVASTVERVNSAGNVVRIDPIDVALWGDADEDATLSELVGERVISLPPEQLLRRCLLTMRTPFTFAATAYSRELYTKVGGYRGNRFYGPDKWFHWRALAEADRVYLVDAPLFAYRWHDDNQAGIEQTRGSLRFLIDEYLNTMQLPDRVLEVAGVSSSQVIDAFMEFDIARHGLASLARGNRQRARQVSAFGDAAYRDVADSNSKARLLRSLVRTGPLGVQVAKFARKRLRVRGPQPRG